MSDHYYKSVSLLFNEMHLTRPLWIELWLYQYKMTEHGRWVDAELGFKEYERILIYISTDEYLVCSYWNDF